MSARIVVSDADVRVRLAALRDRLTSLRPVFQDIGEILLTSTRQRFIDEQGPDGQRWKPLSKQYARWKAKSGKQQKLLRLRGYLFGSLAYQAGEDKVEVGSNVVYAGIHQFGGQVFAGQRTGHVRLKTDRRGNVFKDERGLARFAKRTAKLSAVRTYATKYHEINIPARPFLGFSDSDGTAVRSRLEEYLSQGLG